MTVAELLVDGSELVLRLRRWEALGALRGDVRVPLAAVRTVRVVPDAWKELRGVRAPGTGWPGVIALGTRRGRFGKDFSAVYGRRPGLVVELAGTDFQRIIVSTADPDVVAAKVHDT